jgi:hypothetical protein
MIQADNGVSPVIQQRLSRLAGSGSKSPSVSGTARQADVESRLRPLEAGRP